MKINKFEEIKSWQEAGILVKMIYNAIKVSKLFNQDYRLRDQIYSITSINSMNSMNSSNSINSTCGFTLVELLIACGILVTVLAAFSVTFNRTLNLAEHSRDDYLASAAVRTKLEEMRSHNVNKIMVDYGLGGNPGSTFDVGGLAGKGNISVVDNPGLYGGGESQVITNFPVWSGSTGRHTSLVYDNKMWVIGGFNGTDYQTGVWYTNDLNLADGQTWTQVTTNPSGWPGRKGHTSLVYDNKIWVLGGYDGVYKNDVRYSADGINWIQATNTAWSTGREGHTALVYDNKMWVIGGSNGSFLNEIWYSTDGQTWTQVTANPPVWSGRFGHTSLVYDNKMWIIGGNNGGVLNDIWYTDDTNLADGQTWTQAVTTWVGRQGHTSLVYDNKMWVIRGENSTGPQNDVWYSVGYDRLLEVVITVCWRAKDGRIIGEDTNLNGVLDAGEDMNANSELDSPVKFRGFITDKNELKKTYLGY
ncbi:MAG: prepilin-type N-terminal cleavage/methylation domain-containing protein [Elusimicrobia bacterium]|nr:prepilin-type N-terminal cleavage/methylation domain-containing protein [Elusimicrobiota bacterium]